MGDLSRNALLSGKFRVCVCACVENVYDVYNIYVLQYQKYAVKGLKVVFSQTLAICSPKQ